MNSLLTNPGDPGELLNIYWLHTTKSVHQKAPIHATSFVTPSIRIARVCQNPQLEKLVVWPGIEPGPPAIMACVLSTEHLTGNSVELVCLCILKGLSHESEGGNQIKVLRQCYEAIDYWLAAFNKVSPSENPISCD